MRQFLIRLISFVCTALLFTLPTAFAQNITRVMVVADHSDSGSELSKALPWMFILYGVASALTVVIYSRFADKVARHKLIGISVAIGIVTYIATWVVARSGQATWIYPVFYVWSEVAANLFIVQFWTLANDLHDARSAKRLFSTIGSARILGVVVVGLLAGSIVKKR